MCYKIEKDEELILPTFIYFISNTHSIFQKTVKTAMKQTHLLGFTSFLGLVMLILAWQLALASCKPTAENYEVSYLTDFEIPAGTSLGYVNELTLDSRRDYWLAKYNITADNIEKVEVKFVRFTIFLSNDTFSWVDKGYLKIGKDVATPNYYEIGFNLQPDGTKNYLDLAPDLTELKSYFLADKFKLQIKLLNKLGIATTAPLQVRLSLGMSVFKK